MEEKQPDQPFAGRSNIDIGAAAQPTADQSASEPVAPAFIPPQRWFKTRWGLAVIIAGVVVLAFAALFFYNFVRFYKMIKAGRGDELLVRYSDVQAVDPQVAARRLELETHDDPYLGNTEAKLVIVGFFDYKCPFCKEAAAPLFRLGQTYGNKVKIIIRDFPAESIHPGATALSKLARCAYNLGSFWPAYNWLFESQESLPVAVDDDYIRAFAGNLGLDENRMAGCFNDAAVDVKINQNFADGYRFGVRGTPTFFVNGEKVEGPISFAVWEGYLKRFYNE